MKTKPQESGVVWLYNEGEVSPLIGAWTTTGYKYGSDSSFTQSFEATYLKIYSLSQYNVKGGRTFSSQLQISSNFIGKTLRVQGTQTNPLSGVGYDMRASNAYAIISESVVDTNDTQSVSSSGSFPNNIYAWQSIAGASTTINIDISLPITQAGYVSVVAYKGYGGRLDTHITKIWIE